MSQSTAKTNQAKTNTTTSSTAKTLPANSLLAASAKVGIDPVQAVNFAKEATEKKAASQNQFNVDEFMAKLNQQNKSYLDALTQQNQAMESRINALNQAKQDQAVADLSKARDAQLSNLTTEEAGIKPAYYDKRNATAATNMMNRRTLAEELAARGETNSGVADQANINANMSLQGETGLLNRQEAANIADIAKRKTDVQNAYQNDVTSAKAGLNALNMQNLIDQYNADRQFKLQEAGLTGNYGGQQTLDALNAARNFSLNEAGLTGNYNGQQTLDALNANRNYALNEAGLTGNYNGTKTLAAQNQSFNQDLATKQYNQAVNQQKLDNLYRQQTFDYQKSRDAVSDNQWQKTLDLNLRKQSFDESQQKIANALSQQRISQEDASQALQWAKFNADQDPNSLDNQIKKAQLDTISGKTNTNTTATVDDYASTINSIYVTKPSVSNNYKGSIDTSGVKSYIDKLISAGVNEAITDSLAARYGIQ